MQALVAFQLETACAVRSYSWLSLLVLDCLFHCLSKVEMCYQQHKCTFLVAMTRKLARFNSA